MKCTESFKIKGPIKSYAIYCEDDYGRPDPCAVTECMRGQKIVFDFKHNCFKSWKAKKIVKAMIEKLKAQQSWDQNHNLYINGQLVVEMSDFHKAQKKMRALYTGNYGPRVIEDRELYLQEVAEMYDGRVNGDSVIVEI